VTSSSCPLQLTGKGQGWLSIKGPYPCSRKLQTPTVYPPLPRNQAPCDCADGCEPCTGADPRFGLWLGGCDSGACGQAHLECQHPCPAGIVREHGLTSVPRSPFLPAFVPMLYLPHARGLTAQWGHWTAAGPAPPSTGTLGLEQPSPWCYDIFLWKYPQWFWLGWASSPHGCRFCHPLWLGSSLTARGHCLTVLENRPYLWNISHQDLDQHWGLSCICMLASS
jgi:hypothetical protein